MEPVKKGSLLDFSDLLDAPAGKYGFLRAAGDHFEFEKRPGKPVRFWGVNNSGDANFMFHEESERLADDFASLGYNIIRFAGFDHLLAGTDAASSLDFQTENLDRIDYLIAALKKRGIHITFELYQSRIPYPDEIPGLPAALSWKNKKNYKALLFLSEPVMRNLEQFAEKLLNHVNPYTGLAWKEEPAMKRHSPPRRNAGTGKFPGKTGNNCTPDSFTNSTGRDSGGSPASCADSGFVR